MPFPGTTQLQYVFNGGLNSVVQDFSLDQPNLQQADNAVYNQLGQIDMRSGFTLFSNLVLGGGVITKGAELGVYGNELCLMDGTNLYSYDSKNDIWIDKGSAFSTINSQIRVINTKIATQSNPDATSQNGLQLYIWEDNRVSPAGAAGIRYQIMDTATNTSIVSDQFIYPLGFRPKVIANPGKNEFDIFYLASESIIFWNRVETGRPQILSPLTQIVSDGVGKFSPNHVIGTAYDACLIGGNTCLAYAGSAGISLVTIQPDNTTTNQLLVANDIPSCLAMCVSEAGSASGWWVAYSLATDNPGTFVYNVKTGNITKIDDAVAVNFSIIEDVDTGNLSVTWELSDGTNPNWIKNGTLRYNDTFTLNNTLLKVGLASKPFKTNGQIFLNAVGFTNLQSTYFTLCVTKGMTAIGKHSPQNGGNYRGNCIMAQCDRAQPTKAASAFGSLDTDVFMFGGQRKGAFTTYQNSQSVNLGVAGYTIDFSNPNVFNNVYTNNNLHIVGGVKKIYDGKSTVEDNFNFFPELPDGYGCSVTLVNSAGQLSYSPLNAFNLYQYIVVYEWTDNYGQVQRSGPSVAKPIQTTAAGQGCSIVVPTLTVTDKLNTRTPVSIAIYRTQINLNIFYKITDDNNPLVNDPTVNTLTFLDTFSDTDIAANENLYTGSQLANTAPPACSMISVYQNRLMINNTEDSKVVWFSQNKFEQDQYNTLPLDWNTFFVQGMDRGTGITAMGLLGSGLAIFNETSTFLLQGDGPNALDTSGQFNDAVLVATNVGCTNQNSLVFITQTPSLPGGLMFKSNQGIYLLGLDGNLYPIGEAVRKYNYLTITSANLVPNQNAVIFTSLEGICLIYNYFFNAWTTWSSLPAADAVVWQDQLVLLTPEGNVTVQDPTVWTDNLKPNVTYPVEMTLKTPWIKLNGSNNLQGRMAIYNAILLGTLKESPVQLQVGVSYDYNPAITETVIIESSVASNRWGGLPTWGSNGVWGSDDFSNYQFQINLQKVRGSVGAGAQAIQLTFQTINPSGTQGYSFNALSLEVMPIPGPFALPTKNRVGTR